MNVPGCVTRTTAAAASAPAPRPAFRLAWRTANTAERSAGPTRPASSASWAGQMTDTPRPVRAAAANSSAAEWAAARPAEPAAATTRPAITARRAVHRSASAPPAGLPAIEARAIVASTRPAALSLSPRTRCA
ncbi:MAG TPA: hypothetical protein VGM79_20795 [Streptosporangiaceae bacterium]